MNIGNRLFHARKKCNMSQEEVAAKLGVSRQTVSKWETNETIPDIYQCKKMASLYHMSLDDMIDYDVDVQEVHDMIEKSDESINEKIDWTNAWGKKYPILLKYQDQINVGYYAYKIKNMLDELEKEYQLNKQDAMLVLKDILYQVWKNNH